jgi:hypothetical protein
MPLWGIRSSSPRLPIPKPCRERAVEDDDNPWKWRGRHLHPQSRKTSQTWRIMESAYPRPPTLGHPTILGSSSGVTSCVGALRCEDLRPTHQFHPSAMANFLRVVHNKYFSFTVLSRRRPTRRSRNRVCLSTPPDILNYTFSLPLGDQAFRKASCLAGQSSLVFAARG